LKNLNQTSTKKDLGERTCEKCGFTYQAFSQVVAGREMIFDYCWPCKKKEEDAFLAANIEKDIEKAKGQRLQKIFAMNSYINANLKDCCFENYKPISEQQNEAYEIARMFVEIFSLQDPKNLIFWGSYGSGKSHLAVSILKELMKKDYSGIFVSVPKLLQAFRNTYNNDSEISEGQLLQALETVDCLVLDDIGAENKTDWATDKIFNIIDSRQGKSTIFTSNLDMKALENPKTGVGPRNFSRIMMNANVQKVFGPDHRKG
jgi:DNA replication protein DnaC